MQRSREEVETILTSDLKLALERFESANSALLGESAADEKAKQAKATAAAELRTALRRHNRFILDHEVPEDLVGLAARARAGATD
jgi:hypothetical protein